MRKTPGRGLGDRDLHRYSSFLQAGQALRVQIEQRGIDVKIAASDPLGKPIVEVDRPCGSFCLERLVLVAEVTGQYVLEISKSGDGGPEGRYVIASVVQEAATPADETSLEASKAYQRAKRLASSRKPSDYDAIDRDFRAASEGWGRAKWIPGQADAIFDESEALLQRKQYAASSALALKAAKLYSSLGDKAGESFALVHAGKGYGELKDYKSARVNFSAGARAAEIALQRLTAIGARARHRRIEVQGNLFIAQIHLGQIAASKSWDFVEAKFYLFRARDLARALGDREFEARTVSLLGLIYLKVGNPQRAFELEREARSLLKTVNTKSLDLALVRFDVARIYQAVELPERAAEIYEDLLTEFRALGNRRYQALTLFNLGQSLYHVPRLDDAFAATERARTLFLDLKAPEDVVSALILDGWILGHQDRPEEARAAFQEAIESPHLQPGSMDELSLWFGLADLERRQGDLQHARQYAEKMMAIAQRLGPGVDDPETQALSLAKLHDVYDFWIELLVEMEPPGSASRAYQAFSVSDRVSGTSLQQAAARRAKLALGTPASRPQTDPRELATELLDEQSVLLEYYLAEDEGFLWIVTREDVKLVRIQGKKYLKPKVDSFYRSLASSKKSGPRILAQRAAYELSDLLLEPAKAELAKKRRLLVVTPATLEYVPFAVLPLPGERKERAGDGVWPNPLSSRYEVVMIPSLTAVAAQRSVPAERKISRRMVLFGDPVTDRDDCRFRGGDNCSEAPAARSGEPPALFERLTFAKGEAKKVVAAFAPGRVIQKSGFGARRDEFLNMPLSQFDYLHFVTHGVWNRADPEGSALVLTLYDRRGGRVDGYLRASDIGALHLNSELVVLSACSSGLGHEVWGEGLSGLWQAFLRAGAKRVVVSLWDVNDKATSVLMAHFYEGMFKRGLSPAAALRFAQEEMRHIPGWSSPYYWGGFVLKGDWR